MKKIVSLFLSMVILLSITIGVDFSTYAETSGDYQYTILNDGTAEITKYTGSGGNIKVPSALDSHTVTSIGNNAFQGCRNLISITMPNSMTSIGDYAFYFCESLTSITIPEGVTSIGNKVFNWCEGLTSITMPNSLTSIGDYAFSYCSNLTSITIPEGVTSIGNDAFYCCYSLTRFVVNENNQKYSSSNGILFNKYKTLLIKYPLGNENTSYIIPDGVTNIGNSAFQDCSSLKSITIPDSVMSIGKNAFYNCGSLKSIIIPNSVTSIGSGAFNRCISLTDITIPNSITSISNNTFSICESLTSITIPEGVTSIGSGAFNYCSKLTSITIPDSVTSIGDSAFFACHSLTSITIPDGVTSIGNNAFQYCSSLTSIVVNENNDVYSSLDGVLFNKDKTLLIQYPIGNKNTSYTIPDSVTSIGNNAFYSCSNLTSFVVNENNQKYSSLDGVLFNKDKTLLIKYPLGSENTSYTIPDSVTSIGDSAFYGCKSIEKIVIPNYIKTICSDAFTKCTALTDVLYLGNESEWNLMQINSNPLNSAPNTQVHFFDNNIIKSATCSETGIKRYTSATYSEPIDEIIPKIPHKYVSSIVKATSSSQGYTQYTCSVCGDTYKTDYFNAATVYSDFTDATAGETIRVPISIKNNTGILGWKLTFDYDKDVLTPISVEYGDVISGGIQDNIEGDMVPGSINVYWAGSGNETYNGVMFYINFAVNSSAVGNTKIDISYSPEDTFDDDFNDVHLDCQPININITNNNYSQYAKINASASDVIAGNDVQLKLNISEINSVSNANINVDYNADNFEFKSVNANGVTVKDSNSNGKVTLNVSGITSSANNTDFVILTFKAKDKAMSGNYDFAVSSTDEGIICKGCTVKVTPSATSEIAEIYADDVTANYNEIIAIPVYIENNHGIMGYRLDFKYDATVLQPVSATCGSDFVSNGQFNDSIGVKEGEFKVLWNNVDEKYNNGTLLTLNFKVLTEENIDTVISMTYSQPDTFNEKYEDVVFNCNDINVSLNSHQHSYTAVVTEPTCTQQGYTTYTCSCGDSYKTDYTEIIGHKYRYVGTNDNNELEYSCGQCDNRVTKSIDEVYAMWDVKYVNKPPNRTTVDNSSYLDFVQDNIINAKDFAVINKLAKKTVK